MRNSDIIQPFTIEIQFIIERKNKSSACWVTWTDFGMGGGLVCTGCPEKNAPQFLLNFSGYKHARKLGHNSLERWDP